MAPSQYLTVFDLADEFLREFSFDAPSKLPDVFATSKFPPCNILKHEDNSLEYEFAVAGYDLSEIEIQFDNNYLILTLDPEKAQKTEEAIKYRQIGIRRSKSVSKFFVPVSHYNVEEATANLEKGILTIKIPTKEIAKPKSLKINIT